MALDLPGDVVEDLRDRAIFLPRQVDSGSSERWLACSAVSSPCGGGSGRARRTRAGRTRSARRVAASTWRYARYPGQRASSRSTSAVPRPVRRCAGSTARQNRPTSPSEATAIPTATSPSRANTARPRRRANTVAAWAARSRPGSHRPQVASHSGEAWLAVSSTRALGGCARSGMPAPRTSTNTADAPPTRAGPARARAVGGGRSD